MGIFSIKKKPVFFTEAEKLKIVQAIKLAEQQTSGEIRIYVESRNAYVDAVDRAKEVFAHFDMHKTADRNAVLLYLAVKDKNVALFGDEGIYNKTGAAYWNNAVANMLHQFKQDELVEGIVNCIHQVGQTLKSTFPYNKQTDINELPDDIIFGE